MKKRILSTATLMLALAISAKANLADVLNPIVDDWVKPAFLPVTIIVFIIGTLGNLGKFTNAETRDIKAGIINIVIFVIAVMCIPGIILLFKTITL